MKNNSAKFDGFGSWPAISIIDICFAIYSLTGEDIRGIHLARVNDKMEGERGVLLNRGIAQNYVPHHEG